MPRYSLTMPMSYSLVVIVGCMLLLLHQQQSPAFTNGTKNLLRYGMMDHHNYHERERERERVLNTVFADEFPDRDIAEDLAKLSLAIYEISDGVDPQTVMPEGYTAHSYMDFSDPSPDTEALIVTAPSPSNDIIVVFRGTESYEDWETNFDSGPSQGNFDNSPDTVMLHRGFQEAAFVTVDALENQLNDVIEKEFDGDGGMSAIENFSAGNIYFTGSSLGGALAHIVGTHFADRFRGQSFRVINFGAPRFGNDAFKTWSEEELQDNLSAWRFCYRADFAPRAFFRYSHAGHLFQIWRRSSDAYYRQVGGDGYSGIPFYWHFGSSISHHDIRTYVEFFEEKSNTSRFWPTGFE